MSDPPRLGFWVTLAWAISHALFPAPSPDAASEPAEMSTISQATQSRDATVPADTAVKHVCA